MSPAPQRGPKGLSREHFGWIMEKAVPLDKTGDERIAELLGQLCDERDRRAGKKADRDARRN